MWIPGYWAWGAGGYYWVPGAWVAAPEPGLYWTPGYWAWNGADYVWNQGYWAYQVGYYGGIDYGCGYYGTGYVGGRWSGHHFRYNSYVTRVNTRIVRGRHFAATPAQREHARAAARDRAFRASVNHGRPRLAAVARPFAARHAASAPQEHRAAPVQHAAIPRAMPAGHAARPEGGHPGPARAGRPEEHR